MKIAPSCAKASICVTGAAGLIGSQLVNSWVVNSGTVIACDKIRCGNNLVDDINVVWINDDIITDRFYDNLNQYKIECMVHCAAHPGGRSLQEPAENVRVNAWGSMRLFEWCARRQVPVVYLSSSVVYGEQPRGKISESALLKPGTIYGVCKVACEEFLNILGRGYGLEWTVLRLFSTYGAGHKPGTFQGIVNIMLTQLMAGDKVIVKGSLQRERDMLYVDDAIKAIKAAVLSDEARGEIINIGTGITATIRDLIVELAELLGRDVQQLQITEEAGTIGDPFYNVADISKAMRILKYEPKVSWKQGLQMVVRERLKQNRESV
jgi:UDP-glucose 4-epimerase